MDLTNKDGLRCPHCDRQVIVGTSMVAMQFGLIGAIASQFLKTYHCEKCGKIKLKEFPPATQSRLRSGAWMALGIGIVALAALIGLIAWLATRPR